MFRSQKVTRGGGSWKTFTFTSPGIDAPRNQTLSASSHVAMNHVLPAVRAACGCLRALWPSLFSRQLRTQSLLRRAVTERGKHSAKARLPCYSHMPLPQSNLTGLSSIMMNVMRLTTQTVIPRVCTMSSSPIHSIREAKPRGADNVYV